MVILISAIVIIILAIAFAKKIVLKMLQSSYERTLMKGDRKKAIQIGKMYYLSLDEKARIEKGIVNIEEKIVDDFRSFNGRHFSILL